MSIFPRRHLLKLYQQFAGRKILARFDELDRTQWLGREALLSLQREKLRRLVSYAYRYVPYYHRVFDEAGFNPEDLRKNLDSFRKIPVVTKRYMRDHTEEFLTTDPTLREHLHTHTTSGSTGEPFTFWEDTNYRDYVTAGILRHLTWCGWKLGEPHAYLWGQHMERSVLERTRTSLMDFVLNRFVTNAYVLSEESLAALAARIRSYHPKLLFGYATALDVFARFVQERGIDDLQLAAVYSAGEVLYPQMRERIEAALKCQVFDRYGTLEIGGIACECEAHTGLHLSVENCYVEIMNDGELAGPGESGEMVVTNLNNYGFPFIRYRLADRITLSDWHTCPCGRQSPMLAKVDGRTVDVFKTSDGRSVWGDLEGTIFQVQGIKQSQVIQRALDLVVVRIVRDGDFEPVSLTRIERIVKKMMGDATRVQFEFPDVIEPLRSGKYRYAYSELCESPSVQERKS